MPTTTAAPARARHLLTRVAALPHDAFERVCTDIIGGFMIAGEVLAVATGIGWILILGAVGWVTVVVFVYARYRSFPRM